MFKLFDEIPSEIEIPFNVVPEPTVGQELESCQQLLEYRDTKCTSIDPLYRKPKKVPARFSYRFFCVCPRYRPTYFCKHSGNIIIDRDVLSKEEHICYLAQPKENVAAPRKQPHYYHKRYIMPNCTARIEKLAQPDLKRVQDTLENYGKTLTDRHRNTLTQYLEDKVDIKFHTIDTALTYIDEERRLNRVAKLMEKRRCKLIKKSILQKQRKQIKKIICVLFEEMKDFLLNDQFLIDERSTLCSVILEQIREFTDKEFYTTSNLREYQHVLANNLTVWINKFISNLNIHVVPPKQNLEPQEPKSFIPVNDFISLSESDYTSVEEEDIKTETNQLTAEELKEKELGDIIAAAVVATAAAAVAGPLAGAEAAGLEEPPAPAEGAAAPAEGAAAPAEAAPAEAAPAEAAPAEAPAEPEQRPAP